jgi:REP element-mobilizing transposase RayT
MLKMSKINRLGIYAPEKHQRRSIRLKGYDYSKAGAYFITICTHCKECLFGEIIDGATKLNAYGEIVEKCWCELPNHYENICLDEFVVMPNHIHGIIVITYNVGAIHELPLQRRNMLLPKIIGQFKMQSAKQINQLRHTHGQPVWQRNYYEHIIRNEDELNHIREYILNNPSKWEFDEENPLNR